MAKSKSEEKTQKKTEGHVQKKTQKKTEGHVQEKTKKKADGHAHTEPGATIDHAPKSERRKPAEKMDKKTYEKELARLQVELFKLEEWIVQQKKKVVIIFEGRDAA